MDGEPESQSLCVTRQRELHPSPTVCVVTFCALYSQSSSHATTRVHGYPLTPTTQRPIMDPSNRYVRSVISTPKRPVQSNRLVSGTLDTRWQLEKETAATVSPALESSAHTGRHGHTAGPRWPVRVPGRRHTSCRPGQLARVHRAMDWAAGTDHAHCPLVVLDRDPAWRLWSWRAFLAVQGQVSWRLWCLQVRSH